MGRDDARTPERILAFQRAYDAAGRLLYPDESLIDVARLPQQIDSGEGLRRTDRVLLFARPDCAACDALLARVLAKARPSRRRRCVSDRPSQRATMDAIRNWARARGIRPEWVTTRRVTLNFEGGALARVAPGETRSPS